MGANSYSCENSFGAINHRLWLKNGHILAIFLLFWAFSVTLMAVATTVILTLGIGCTQRLVRHIRWWYGTIFALSSQIAMSCHGAETILTSMSIVYWHPWLGPIFITFGYLEASFADNSFILLRMSWKEPAPLLGGTLPINLTNISVVWQNPTAHDMEAPCREVSSFSVTMSGDAHSCICIQIMCVSHLYLILMFIFADVHNFSLVINAQTSIGLL